MAGAGVYEDAIDTEADEGLVGDERPCSFDSGTVAAGLGIGDQRKPEGRRAGGRAIGGLVEGLHYNCHGIGRGNAVMTTRLSCVIRAQG